MSIQRYDMEDGCLIDARDGFLCQYADLQSREAKLLAAIEAAKMDAGLLDYIDKVLERDAKAATGEALKSFRTSWLETFRAYCERIAQ